MNKTTHFGVVRFGNLESENSNIKSDKYEISQESREAVRNYRPIDDVFFQKIAEDKECIQDIIRIILGEKYNDLVVISVRPQETILNLQGRGVRLDCYAVDSKGNKYDIEVQRTNSGAVPQRARYNSSLLDANHSLESSQGYKDLRDNWVIFITEKDYFKRNQPKYTVERVILENNELFNDGSHIVYVNSKFQDSTALGNLMRDFYQSDASKVTTESLRNRIAEIKDNEKEMEDMAKTFDEYMKKSEIKGEIKGEISSLIKIYRRGFINRNQLTKGIEEIMTEQDISDNELKDILSKLNASDIINLF